ncbi:MAG: ATP-binding protein [Muribaculaceae bacterium]|nr:ATP-binding protein [Muribaculaceae bacterium]
MILEVRLSNIFSLREEVILDMQAAKIQTAAARALSCNVFYCGDEQMLKSVGIIGANASGKSNVIKAIRAFVNIIRESHNYNENTCFGIVPFKFDGYADKPSAFYMRFLLDGTEYEYAFSVFHDEILSESLYYYPKGRRSLVFRRDESMAGPKEGAYTFKKAVSRPQDVVENTSRKTLFLSRASQMDREIAKSVFKFFTEQIKIDFNKNAAINIEAVSTLRKDRLLAILQEADSDIVDVRIQNGGLTTFHRSNPDIPFDFETEESEGTKVLFRLMLDIMVAVDSGRLLLVDEIESSLHTKLVEYIIDMFHKSDNAQLIYTTHNTHLLNMHRIRRDQLYFVNKRNNGATDLYSLYDFKDFRDNMDLEKAYLQGRFDAIPYILNQND